MWNDPAVRRSLIVSLVASLLFFLFIQPLLTFMGWFIRFLALNFHSGLSNALYRSASLGDRNYLDVYMFGLYTSALCGITTGALTFPLSRKYLKKYAPTHDHFRRKLVVLRRLMTALLVLLSGMNLSDLTIAFGDLQLNASFKRRLTVIAPHISEQQEEELAAMWASMRSRQDYNAVNERMEAYAGDANISLPKSLWR